MPDPQISFDAPQDVALDQALTDMAGSQGKPVEVVGKANPASFEEALGLDDARGREVIPNDHPKLNDVLDGQSNESMDVETVRELARLEAENQFLKSEKGRYGREVVGPLRKENEELHERLDALETALKSQGAPAQAAAPMDPAQYARQLYGPHVDVEDPEVMRQVHANLAILDAAERGTRAYVDPVLQEVRALREDLNSTREYAEAGMSREQVRQAEQAFPELKDLPDSKKASLIRRLTDASKGSSTPERDARGRFVAGDARATANPEHFVEGGSGVAGPGGLAADPSDNQKWQRRMERFKALGRDRDAGGAAAQKHVFLDMLRKGEFR